VSSGPPERVRTGRERELGRAGPAQRRGVQGGIGGQGDRRAAWAEL